VEGLLEKFSQVLSPMKVKQAEIEESKEAQISTNRLHEEQLRIWKEKADRKREKEAKMEMEIKEKNNESKEKRRMKDFEDSD
jgi:hypothetical protein